MTDIGKLPRLAAMTYYAEEDIPVTYPGRINRYLKGIRSAIMRLDRLRRRFISEDCESSNECIELAFSMRNYLQMFRTINRSINNPNHIITENLDSIRAMEQKLNAIILSKSWLENPTEIPSISPYELAIRIIIDNCIRAGQTKDANDLISLFLVPI